MNNLFVKQVDKGYKRMWVLHSYLKKTKDVTLTSADRLDLITTFGISDTYLTQAIDKSKEGISDESKELRQKYFMEQTFARGIEVKSFDRHMRDDN